MKTKVNLYSAEFQPTLRLLSVGILLSSWLLMVVVLLTFWAVKLNQQQTLTDQLNKLNQQNEEQSTLVATLQTGLANRQSDPLLLQEVNKKVSELGVKNRVLQELQGQEDLKTNGFSTLMLDLANHHQTGLWLTQVSLDGHQVKLVGKTLDSSLVPSWINSLGTTAYFKGQEFAETRLFRDAEQQLHFSLSSSPSEGALVTEGGNGRE
ncbi:PilN domain-containing protein [Paraglaciecola sp. 25GB23A]|uniref:PilN domain-containing protein n=1 Tax=Paraglaciecola sp. 25GB23A TaxID=3156068 RepID=UPI0032AF23FC